MGVHFFVMQLISIVVFICCVVNVLNGFGAGPDRSVDVIILCIRPLGTRRKCKCDCDKVEQELNRGMENRLDKDDIGGSIDLGGGGEYGGERVPLDSEQGSLVQRQDLVRENGTSSVDEVRRRRDDGDRYRYGNASDGGGGVSSVVSNGVVSNGMVPTSVVPTSVVPTSVVSNGVVSTNTAPTNAVPTSIVTPTQSVIPTPTTVPTPTTPTTHAPTIPTPPHTLPTLHTRTSPTQQHLLDKWLDSFCQRQSLHSHRTPTVYYDVYKFAGLGNVFRGFFSAMTISVLTNRNVQGRSVPFLPF